MTKAKPILLSGIIGIIITLCSLTYFLIKTYQSMVVKPITPIVKTTPTPIPTPDPNRSFSILMLGYGGGIHEGGRLTDSIMVIKIDPHAQTTTLISIPRDLWVPLPINGTETKQFKINAAYAIGLDDRQYPNKNPEFTGDAGGGQMSKTVVSQILGFPIDYFFSLDFTGFTKAIDYLGGVGVMVDIGFTDPAYPIEKDVIDNCGRTDADIAALTATMSGTKLEAMFPCRYETLSFSKGFQTMDGAAALKYARSRHSPTDGGDYNRARRQRILVDSIKKKVISIGFVPKIIPLIQTLSTHVKTDIDFSALRNYLFRAEEFSAYPVTHIALTDQNVLINGKSADGQFVLLPRVGENDWTEIQTYLRDPSSFVTPVPTRYPTKSPTNN